MSFLGGLGKVAQGAVNFAPYAEQAVARNDQRGLQEYAQQRQKTLDEQSAALHSSTMRKNSADVAHLAAETAAIGTKSDVKGVHAAQDGTMWVEHTDGTFSPAQMRGAPAATPTAPAPTASAPITPSAPRDENAGGRAGDIDLRDTPPQSVAPQAVAPTPQQPTPKFGPRPPREPNPATIPGTPENLKAKEAELKLGAKYRQEPQQTYTPFQVTTPDGKPDVRPFNTKTGQFGQPADVTPKTAAAGGGSASLSSEDRARMMNQAKLDHETMKRVEDRVLRGELTFGTGAGLATAAAGAHGSPLNEAMGVLGNAAAGAMDPDIQSYITANDSYGRIMGNLQSKRYTDNQAGIEKRISGLKGNDLANTIRYKQQLRESSLADPVIQPQSTGGRGGGPGAPRPAAAAPKGGAPTKAQALWDAAVAKHGQAKVIQEVGPRPDGEE